MPIHDSNCAHPYAIIVITHVASVIESIAYKYYIICHSKQRLANQSSSHGHVNDIKASDGCYVLLYLISTCLFQRTLNCLQLSDDVINHRC